MAFSFYSSLKSIPKEMMEATRIYRYSAWQRFWQLEMPFAAIGLIWNSIVSVASGWFVLIPCEMLTFGDHSFHLPGLGSYLYSAASPTRWTACPLLGHDGAGLHHRRHRPVDLAAADCLERQIQIRAGRIRLPRHLADPHAAAAAQRASAPALRALERRRGGHLSPPRAARVPHRSAHRRRAGKGRQAVSFSAAAFAVRCCAVGREAGSSPAPRGHLGRCALSACLARRPLICGSAPRLLIAALWTIPVGVAIGSNPKLAQVLQPITQIVASIPASAFFPVLMLVLIRNGLGLGIGSIALMLLGTQWYVLFNVIAGAMAIPSDLKRPQTSTDSPAGSAGPA